MNDAGMAMRQMTALVFDGPARTSAMTRVASVDVPDPGPGEVLIEVGFAGINFKDAARTGRRGRRRRLVACPSSTRVLHLG